MNATIAKLAIIDQENKKLWIDGEEFPYAIEDEPRVERVTDGHELFKVTVTFFTDAVEVLPSRT